MWRSDLAPTRICRLAKYYSNLISHNVAEGLSPARPHGSHPNLCGTAGADAADGRWYWSCAVMSVVAGAAACLSSTRAEAQSNSVVNEATVGANEPDGPEKLLAFSAWLSQNGGNVQEVLLRQSELLAEGLIDERMAIVLYIMVQRLLGPVSSIAPWLQALPTQFSTPLSYSDEQLAELRGTNLHAAANSLRARLQRMWPRLREAACVMTDKAGVHAEPTFEDLVWAYCAFWSRAQGLPLGPPGDAQSALGSAVVEGVVPGLDFCNHSLRPNCWWQPVVPKTTAGSDPAQHQRGMVELLCRGPKGQQPTAGTELLISYGDKSNEELLLLYGFALPFNPHDQLMLHVPLPPPQEWDSALSGRMLLLQERGLRPQFFLPAAAITQPRAWPATQPAVGPDAGQAAIGTDPGRTPIPKQALQTLAIMTMPASHVQQALQLGQSASSTTPAAADGQQGAARTSDAADLGSRMAGLSTLVRMLEATVVQLEGPGGTGPLEVDAQKLAVGRHRAPSPEAWAAVVYRAGQKWIVREYLLAAREELQEVMQQLQAKSRPP